MDYGIPWEQMESKNEIFILNEKLTYSMYSPAVPPEVFSGNILFALPACFFRFC